MKIVRPDSVFIQKSKWLASTLFASSLLCYMLITLGGLPKVKAEPAGPLLVTSTADSGPGSLRSILLSATISSVITFDPSVFPPGSPATINLQSPLPTISNDYIVIDASSAGVILNGSQIPINTHPSANGFIIDGNFITVQGVTIRGFSSNGIFITPGAANNIIGGDRTSGTGPNGEGNQLVLNGNNGLEIRGNNNVVTGNFIGMGLAGQSLGNAKNGIIIWQGADNNTIGGLSPEQRNIISWNNENGIWISDNGTTGNSVIGNYLGTNISGTGSSSNRFAGVAIQNNAQNNILRNNVISGNSGNGIYISEPNSENNQILGNIIGLNASGNTIIGQGLNGIEIQNAGRNIIGDGTTAGRNIISGASYDGIAISGINSISNTVKGNYIGSNITGSVARPNGLHGVEIRMEASSNQIGGNRLIGEGNLLSGNGNHGVVINNADNNWVAGNIIGPDITGSYSLGNHPAGGIDIANTAANNTIGGEQSGEGNLISGNQLDGIALFDNVTGNKVLSNTIGASLSQNSPLPNISNSTGVGGYGVLIAGDSFDTMVQGNLIAYNDSHGLYVNRCIGSPINQNRIFSNGGHGISTVCTHTISMTAESPTSITGTSEPNSRIEIFSDDSDEGAIFEGFAIADGNGDFIFNKISGFSGPNVTAVSTLTDGSSSAFSQPLHFAWTFLIYLNGDNDLDEFMVDTQSNIINAAPSPLANVIILIDGAGTNDTRLYDATYSPAVEIPLSSVFGSPSELNMGDGQTLVDFVNWGRSYYPVRYTLLSIVDHGGGWAPSSALIPAGALSPERRRAWGAGNSGLSWDLTGDLLDYDYINSQEMRQVMESISTSGGPIDVLYYDVCLMGLIEVAAQIQPYATYFVSSQNIGWAPMGPENRYIRAIQNISPDAQPLDVAQLLVTSYSNGIPAEDHPYTVSAVDLTQLPALVDRVQLLGTTISATLTTTENVALLQSVYDQSQKIDYDSDLILEPATDGFVDLYHFAELVQARYPQQDVVNAATDVITQIGNVVVAESHRSGSPWFATDRTWDLDNANGISIFLPLGEDLELPIVITETISPGNEITRNLRLRDLYTNLELDFLNQAGAWSNLIQTYYDATTVGTGLTQGPVSGLQRPDVTPPETNITTTVPFVHNQPIQLTWTATDSQNAVIGAELWYSATNIDWTFTHQYQAGSSGTFTYAEALHCGNNYFAIRAIDSVGNIEDLDASNNNRNFYLSCLFLPLLSK